MDYISARRYIKDGDLIAVKESGLVPDIVKKVTNSPYAHAGLAVILDGGVWVAQMNSGGNNLVPLSQFKTFDVYECPVDTLLVRAAILKLMRHTVTYSYWDLIVSGLQSLFNIKVPPTKKGLVCSGMCVRVYKMCGWNIDAPIVPSPAWVANNTKFKLSIS